MNKLQTTPHPNPSQHLTPTPLQRRGATERRVDMVLIASITNHREQVKNYREQVTNRHEQVTSNTSPQPLSKGEGLRNAGVDMVLTASITNHREQVTNHHEQVTNNTGIL